MNHPSFKRLVALCLALILAFSGLISTACNSGSTSTTPSPTVPETVSVGPEVIRVISSDSDSIEVEGVDPAMGGSFRLRIEGMRSERPIYYVNGVLAGELFGNAASPSATRPANGPQEADRRVSAPVIVPALLAALAAWSVVQIVDACGTQFYFAIQDGSLGEQTLVNCLITAATGIAGKLGGTILSKCGCIGKIKDAIYAAAAGSITWRTLHSWISQRTFKLAAEVVAELSQKYFNHLYAELMKSMAVLLTEQPPDPDPDPNPTPNPNPPPSPPPTPNPNPIPGLTAWAGSFTATGSWEISSGCFWRYTEEWSNVTLAIRTDGTGSFTAFPVRVTFGPKIGGPANCPNNTSTSEMSLWFNLSATPVAGGWQFEKVSDGLGGPSRFVAGTATATSATGTYVIKTSTLQATIDFTLGRRP